MNKLLRLSIFLSTLIGCSSNVPTEIETPQLVLNDEGKFYKAQNTYSVPCVTGFEVQDLKDLIEGKNITILERGEQYTIFANNQDLGMLLIQEGLGEPQGANSSNPCYDIKKYALAYSELNR